MTNRTLLLDTAAKWCASRFRENKIPFLSAIFIGLLCHMYAFTNKLVNHDEVNSLFIKGATVSSGRWGLGFLDAVFPNYSMPWIYGIMTIIFIAAAGCLILRILSIESSSLQVLLSGAIMAFPSLTGTLAYMFTSSSFALSFLMAVLAVWFLRKKGVLSLLAGLGCMVFSLSIYQSYISVAAGLLVVVLMGDILRKDDLSTIVRRGIGYVIFLAASLGIYYTATQIILLLKDVTFNAYASGNMGFRLSGIPAAVMEAYRNFFRFFTEGYQGLIPSAFSCRMHLICLAAAAVLLVIWCCKTRSPGHILLLLALTLILPLAINCMYLFTTAASVHTLVLYGFICLYAFFAVIADSLLPLATGKKYICAIAANILSLSLALILVCNIYLANQVWLNLQLRYENAYAFYTTLLSDIKDMPEFGPESRLALIGNYQEPPYYEEKFAFTAQITGTKGFLPDSYSREQFLEYYIGTPISFVSEEELLSLSGDPTIMQMPVYPYYGSVTAIGDTIVVKLS